MERGIYSAKFKILIERGMPVGFFEANRVKVKSSSQLKFSGLNLNFMNLWAAETLAAAKFKGLNFVTRQLKF